MNPKINIKVQSLSEASLHRKFAIAFVFMSSTPILLIIFIAYHLNMTQLIEREMPYFRLTILLVILLSLASFDLIRRSMLALERFSEHAKDIANGDYNKRVQVNDNDEIGTLAQSFNKITGELEDKIKQLQSSKKLLQNILNKIGAAVTSKRGIENLLELVIQTLVQGADATAGLILLIDESTSELRIKAAFGIDKSPEINKIKTDEGLIGRVIRLKKPEIAHNISTNPAGFLEFKKELAKESIMVAPLLLKDRISGVIVISDKRLKSPFNNDDLLLLTNVSAQAAVAIENFQLNEDIEKAYLDTVTALAVAVEAKDPYSRGHLERVTAYVEKLGKGMGLDEEMMKVLRNGAHLHDVGKIGIRDEILRKKGPLTEAENGEMREHVIIGVNIIKPIRTMMALCELVRYHQEFYDGSGYPDKLKGEAIPLTARILKVCDAFDAMTTDRPYRKGMNKAEAKKELLKKSGQEFDPKIVEEFLKIV